jgi:hypothetical protein
VPACWPGLVGRGCLSPLSTTGKHWKQNAEEQREDEPSHSQASVAFCGSDDLLGGLIYRETADDGAEDARFRELRLWKLREIVRKDEIGVLARLQFTLLPFLELRVGGA